MKEINQPSFFNQSQLQLNNITKKQQTVNSNTQSKPEIGSPGKKFQVQFLVTPESSQDTSQYNISVYNQILCLNCQNFVKAELIDIHSTYCIYSDPDEKRQNKKQYYNSQQVLCVNCQNYINKEVIEKHSIQCTSVLQHVQIFEKQIDQEVYLNFKLQKLSEALQNLLQQKIINFNVPIYLRTMLTQCCSILNCKDFVEIQREILNINRIKTKIENQKNMEIVERTYLTIYLERLKTLANDKYELYKQRVNVVKETSSISNQSSATLRDDWSDENESTEKMSVFTQNLKFTEDNVTSEVSDFSDLKFHQKASQKQNNFMKKFMGLKIMYGFKHPAQKIQAKSLYRLARAKNIQEAE